jgi:hypothetical protein
MGVDPYWLIEITRGQQVVFLAPEPAIFEYLPTSDEDKLPDWPVALEPPHLLRRRDTTELLHSSRSEPGQLRRPVGDTPEGDLGSPLVRILVPRDAGELFVKSCSGVA